MILFDNKWLKIKQKTVNYTPVVRRGTELDTSGTTPPPDDDVLEKAAGSVSSKLTFTSRSENLFAAMNSSILSL